MKKLTRIIYLVCLLLLLGITIFPPVRSNVVHAVWTDSGNSIDPQIFEQWDTSTNRLLFLDFDYVDYIQDDGRWIELTYQATIGYQRLIVYYIAIIILTIIMLLLTSSKMVDLIDEITGGKWNQIK